MLVCDLMTRNVAICHRSDPLVRAAAHMAERDCSWVPVLDDGDRLLGGVDHRSVCGAVATAEGDVSGLTVESVMHPVPSVHRAATLTDAGKAMRSAHRSVVAVLDSHKRLVGVLSLSDLAREAWSSDTADEEHLNTTDIAYLLAVLARERHPLDLEAAIG